MRETRACQDGFVELDGARLRLRDEGDGFPVLLIHGWALDLDMWEPQAAAWQRRLRVIRYDRRGFGESSGRPSLDMDVRDAESLLRRLNLGRVAVVGMSQGARAALRLALGRMRATIACLVLDGAPFEASGDGESEVPLERYREIARERGLDAVRDEWLAHPLMQLTSADRRVHDLLARMTARYPGHDLLATAHAVRIDAPAAADVEVPALVLNGALDTPRRLAMGDELARALRYAERAIIAGAGHLPNLDNPAQYNARVLAFIERHAAGAAPGR